jgi:hypothetical protein
LKPKDVLEILAVIWKQLSATLPSWLVSVLEVGKYVVLLLVALWVFLFLASQIKKLWLEIFGPLFYDEEKKRRNYRRRQFADHVESELRRLSTLEEWSDYRFAELEAEVEAEGQRRQRGFWPRTVSGLRRERSLSRALRTSTERLILVEGEPGAGKSVALRHVAVQLAQQAMKAKRADSLVPIYVNLKELNRPEGGVVDRNLIHDFVLASLNRVNSRDVDEFLEDEFDRGVQEGTWLFLFDSFDELPEVLSATEADSAVRDYADAIADFLAGFNQCRGILASRAFRGPKHITWPRFRVLPLTEARRLELVRRSGLDVGLEKGLIGQLATSGDDIQSMTSNPMLLGLICHRVRDGLGFPENAHSVFETYIGHRLTRDAERLKTRFELEPGEVRRVAEVVAFSMSADQSMGLSPSRKEILTALERQEFASKANFGQSLSALEYIKLARADASSKEGLERTFTFAHRRFQEYFATCTALAEPDRIAPRALITDARWRETAVTICQTQSVQNLEALLDDVRVVLSGMCDAIPRLAPVEGSAEPAIEIKRPFPWPRGALHLLKILEDGFARRPKDLPDIIRNLATHLLETATLTGTAIDRKLALEVVGSANSTTSLQLIRAAFESDSLWLKDTAYRQTAMLQSASTEIDRWIRQSLVRMTSSGVLRKEYIATKAHLSRLRQPAVNLHAARLFLWASTLDTAIMTLFLAASPLVALTLTSKDSDDLAVSGFFAIYVALTLVCFLISRHSFKNPHQWPLVLPLSLPFRLFISLLLADTLRCAVLPTQAPSGIGDFNDASMLGLAAIFYIAIWPPAAVIAGITGKFVTPRWWILQPIISPITAAAETAKWLQKIGFKKVATSLTVLAVFVPLCAASTALLLKANSLTILLIAIILFLPIVPIALGVFASHWRWFRWRPLMKELDMADFLHLLGSFSNSHRLQFVRVVTQQELLEKSNATIATLEDLLGAIELSREWLKIASQSLLPARDWEDYLRSDLQINIARTFDWPSLRFREIPDFLNIEWRSDILSAWLREYTSPRKFRIAWQDQVIDELSRLLEKMYASQGEVTTPPEVRSATGPSQAPLGVFDR